VSASVLAGYALPTGAAILDFALQFLVKIRRAPEGDIDAHCE